MPAGTGIYVPTEQLGDGTADSTKFLRGDSTWAVPAGGGGDHSTLTNLDADDHPQYEQRVLALAGMA